MSKEFDFNRQPYFDDYDESKNFYKILFRPGRAVQTRELNQIQTMIQKQIERFGNHIFREGSLVLGGQIDLDNNVDFVRLNPVDIPQFSQIDFQSFVGTIVEGQLSGLTAYVIAQQFDSNLATQVLMVRYLNSNELDEVVFRAEENIVFGNTGLVIPTLEQNSTGKGTVLGIEEGVIFVRGYFVQFPTQSFIVDPYSRTPSVSVGFVVSEPNIVTSVEDESLLDNAQGTFNFVAPGADRFILSLQLTTVTLGENGSDDTFSLIANIENGEIIESRERSQYSRIYEEIAKRTFDESGDYYVNGMTIRTREALDTGTNEGLSPTGDPNKISIDIEPGLAYVKGYEINNLVTSHTLIDKGIDFKSVNNAIVTARTGGFVVINEIVGSLSIDDGVLIDLFDDEEQRVTNATNVTVTPTGDKIGEARVKTTLYESGSLGTANGSLKLFLFDIRMNAGKIVSDIKSVSKSGSFFADVSVGLSNNIENTLIYPIGTANTRKLRKQSDESLTDTNYSFYTSINNATIPQNSKIISVSSPVPLAYGLGTLSASEKRSIFVSLNTELGAPNSLPTGAHFDLGNSSVVVTITSSTTFTIDLGTTFTDIASPTQVTVTFKGRRAEIFETPKQLVNDVYVKINYGGSGAPDSLTSPINLGLPDVYRIKEVRRKNGSDFSSETDGEDVTSSFSLDNNQKDNFYDHSKLIPLGGVINSGDRLLIKLDAFRVTSHSYFSVDSYPVDDSQVTATTIFTYEIPKYISSVGTEFELKDCLDYRPVKESTASYSGTAAGASTNPALTDDFVGNINTQKIEIPVASSIIQFDYSFFLARRDVLALDQNGNFVPVRGVPSLSPVTPNASENLMPLSNIFIPPFPSISQSFARILGLKDNFVTHERIANKRFTMRDIGALRNRIENLEYYNALNLLEKETSDLLILDANGNDRFKNGFFADGFMDHSLGATNNPDYNIAVDKIEQVMRPVFEVDSFNLEYEDTGTLEQVGNLLHLPILSEETLLDQPRVTTRRNVEQSVYRFIGNLQLDPDNDVWADETTVDKTVELGNDLPSELLISTEWESWETHIVGYNTYKRKRRDRSGDVSKADYLGTFSSYADAYASLPQRKRKRFFFGIFGGGTQTDRTLIETIAEDQRVGVQSFVTYEKETQEFGNFVTDVSLVPYIRPQAIEFYADGIKPNTRHWIFFDGEEMSDLGLVRQYTNVDDPTEFTAAGTDIRSNEFGEIRGTIFLPPIGKRFRIGTKDVKVTDNPTISLDDISSIAENYFIASGINVQKQNTILSTKLPTGTRQEQIFETRDRRAVDVEVLGPSCIAYTFKVNVPPEEEGTFLTSIDLFFQEFHPELGFRVQIRELNSGGNITQNVLPYSEVWVPRLIPDGQGGRTLNTDLKTSQDGSVATNVEFLAPVFVYNETTYAIVISAENINPDTYLWISRLGETDLITQQPVTSRPLTGAVFTTNNGVNWDIVPQADLKVKINRAKFETNVVRNGILKNRPYEFFQLTNVQSLFSTIGENIKGSEQIIINFSSGSASVGNVVTGSTSSSTGDVVAISASTVSTTGFGFEVGETVTFTDNGTPVATGTITSINAGLGKLKKYIAGEQKMQLSGSNGRFFEGAIIEGEVSEITAEIQTLESQAYSTSSIKPDFINFNKSFISFEKRGRRSSDNSFIEYEDGAVDSSTSFDEELHLLSRSTERALFGATGSSKNVRVQMSSESEYLSPILDISRAHSILVNNKINADIAGEDSESGGNLINKYITKTVTLQDGQDAEDLLVFLSAYRPPSGVSVENDIKVWMKVRNIEDPESLSDKPWVEMISDNNNFSSAENSFDFLEISFTPPPSLLDINGVVSYDVDVGGTPVTLTSFKQYAVKIGILGGNSAIVPKIADLRAIALQK